MPESTELTRQLEKLILEYKLGLYNKDELFQYIDLLFNYSDIDE